MHVHILPHTVNVHETMYNIEHHLVHKDHANYQAG